MWEVRSFWLFPTFKIRPQTDQGIYNLCYIKVSVELRGKGIMVPTNTESPTCVCIIAETQCRSVQTHSRPRLTRNTLTSMCASVLHTHSLTHKHTLRDMKNITIDNTNANTHKEFVS